MRLAAVAAAAAMTLAAVAAVAAPAAAQGSPPPLEAPEVVGGSVWSAAVRVGEGSAGGAVFGYSRWNDIGEITSVGFSFDGQQNEVQVVGHQPSTGELHLSLSRRIDSDELALRVGGHQFALGDAYVWLGGGWTYTWETTGIDWATGDIVNAYLLVPPPPDPATLGGLDLDGLPDVDFDPGRSRYDVEQPPGATTATVTAEGATDDTDVDVLVVRTDGDLGFDGTDADLNTDGHQALLSATGQTLIVVKSDDGARERAYIIRTTPAENAGGAESQSTVGKQRFSSRAFVRSSVGRSTDSGDATLASLALTGAALDPEFDAGTHTYQADAASDTSQVTVTAEPNTAGAEVAITPADADTDTDGHQVNLLTPQPGGDPTETTIGVVVKSTDNNTLFLYQITVTRAAPQQATRPPAFARNPELDLTGIGRNAAGLWRDRETWFVAYFRPGSGAEEILAYNAETLAREPDKDLTTLNHELVQNYSPFGLYSDGKKMWVVDHWKSTLYSFSLGAEDYGEPHGAGCRFCRAGTEFELRGITGQGARGLWSDGETAWVASDNDSKVFAYDLNTGRRSPELDIDTLDDEGNDHPGDLWSDGYTMWVSDYYDNKIYAYDMATKLRQPDLEFNTLVSDREYPEGLWSDGTTMWVIDWFDEEAHAYNMPTILRLDLVSATDVELERRTLRGYFGQAANSVTQVTVAATAAHSDHTVAFGTPDAGPDDGHQWNLDVGKNQMAVTVSDGTISTQHTLTVTRVASTPPSPEPDGVQGAFARNPERDLTGIGRNATALWSDGETWFVVYGRSWFQGGVIAKILAYDAETLIREPAKDITSFTRENIRAVSPLGLYSDGEKMWVTDRLKNTLDPYSMGADDYGEPLGSGSAPNVIGATFDLGGVTNRGSFGAVGLWSDGETAWVASDSDSKVFAYELDTGRRITEGDIDTLKGEGNHHPGGLWSDGHTMWVSDYYDDKIYAYDMATKLRQRHLELNTLDSENGHAHGLWSDGTTMWIADWPSDKAYAYDMPTILRLDQLSAPDVELERRTLRGYFGQAAHSVTGATIAATAAHSDHTVAFGTADADADADGHQWNLAVGENTLAVSVTDGTETVVYTVTVTRAAAPTPNNQAEGRPTITGTTTTGSTLTAVTSGISDADGMQSAAFSYQWLRSDAEITDATGSTYTVVLADEGEAVKVRVSFTDDAGFSETRTSDGLDIPVVALEGFFDETTVPGHHNGANTTFTFDLYFSVEPSLGFEDVRDDVLTLTNGSVTRAARTNPQSEDRNSRWTITVAPGGSSAVTIAFGPTTECTADSAVCTTDAKMLSNSGSITVAGP